MNASDALAFVAENHHAVLATRRSDGAPQLSPVVAAVDADDKVVISTRETAFKVRHLRRDPHLWLCVLPDSFFGRWIWLEGDVEILSLPDAMEPLKDYYRSVSGEHPNWDEYEAAMRAEQRVLLRVSIARAGPDQQG